MQVVRVGHVYILILLISISNISCGKDFYVYNLATDMIMETDVVFSDGFRSDMKLSEMAADSTGKLSVAEIHSKFPLMSWMIWAGDRRDVYQQSYRIIVDTLLSNISAGIGSVWDSGDVEDANSVCVRYGGPQLEPATVYYWSVSIRDSRGRSTDFSEPKAFMTAVELDGYTSVLPLEKTVQQPVSMHKIGNCLLADFGSDLFGQLLLRFNSFTGEKDKVYIHLGESLLGNALIDDEPQGLGRYSKYEVDLVKGYNRYQVQYQYNPRNTDPNVNGGAVPVLMPPLIGEVMPFRYVEIDDYNGPLLYSNITRHAVTYPFDDKASHFVCSDTVVNKVWNLCKHTMKATSFAGTFVDGDRERITYEADTYVAQLSHYAVDYNYSLARNTLERLMYHPTWPTEWILLTVSLAYNDYLYTGDASFLEQYYEELKLRTLWQYASDDDHLLHSGFDITDTHLLRQLHTHSQYIRDIVDWPKMERDGYSLDECNASTNAFYYKALYDFAKIAQAVGNSRDARCFEQLASQTRDAINEAFIENRLYADNLVDSHVSLHSNMYPMSMGVMPDSIMPKVSRLVLQKGMACSVFGAQFLLDALYDYEYQDQALALLADTSSRSWYNMIRMGSTITTEAWNDEVKDNMDWNHAWGASPANIITRRLMGIRPLEPGFSRVEIRPQTSSLSHAHIKSPTPRGPVTVDVSSVGKNEKMLTVTIPPNMTAEIYVPGQDSDSGPEVVGSGHYKFKF
ncbi:MAG: alpha-L-rhamnosidase [Bacteroidales bacterium]|nr:alpha-L-rhamnosidase [Bacteroidales bacterium]